MVRDSYEITFTENFKTHPTLIPIPIKPKAILEDVTHLLLKEVVFKDEGRIKIYEQLSESLKNSLIAKDKEIEFLNEYSC